MRRLIGCLLVLASCAYGSRRFAYNPAVINNAATRPLLREGSIGPAVMRAQILLSRAHFSVGEIDATLGRNMEEALKGFRASRGLPPGSTVDAVVWNALEDDTAPPIVPYAINAEDVKGPFVKVPTDMMAQAKLSYLGCASPKDEIAERFHLAPELLQRLNPGKVFTRVGERILVPNASTEITGQAAKIVVSKSANTLTLLDESSSVIAQYPCSSGSEHDPLPMGAWKVVGIARNPKFHYNPALFWDAKPEDAKATIAPGPRNPVGLVWIDISKEHYGIHGTPDPALVGDAQSHGCIRLTNWDALEVAGLVKPGTPVDLVE
jgi:lipoprotein-anchoring transpeptidase ErfK/SrfK